MDSEPILLLTVDEAADMLRISRSRLYQFIAAGDIASVRIGSLRRIRPAAVHDFIHQMEMFDH